MHFQLFMVGIPISFWYRSRRHFIIMILHNLYRDFHYEIRQSWELLFLKNSNGLYVGPAYLWTGWKCHNTYFLAIPGRFVEIGWWSALVTYCRNVHQLRRVCKSITQAIWHREVWDNILLEIKITETVNKWYIVGNWKPGVFLAKYNTIAFARMIESPSFDTQHSTHLKYAQWGAYTFMKRNYRWNGNPPITKKMTVCPPITNIVCLMLS